MMSQESRMRDKISGEVAAKVLLKKEWCQFKREMHDNGKLNQHQTVTLIQLWSTWPSLAFALRTCLL